MTLIITDENRSRFASAVKAARKKRKLTQLEFATETGLTAGKIAGAEGGRKPKADTVAALEPYVLEFMEDQPADVAPEPSSTALPYDQQKAALLERFEGIQQRLNGRPAPPIELPTPYRIDQSPPELWPAWVLWMNKVDAWLNEYDQPAGTAAGAAPCDPGTPSDAAPAAPAAEAGIIPTWAWVREQNEPADPEPELGEDPGEHDTPDMVPIEFGGTQGAIVDEPLSPLEQQLAASIERARAQGDPMSGGEIAEKRAAPRSALPAQPTSSNPTAAGVTGVVLEFPGGQAPPARVERVLDVITLDPGLRYVTNGEVNTALECRRRWWLEYYRALGYGPEKRTGAAALGTRVHKALSVHYVPDGEAPGDPLGEYDWCVADDRRYLEEQKASDAELKQLDKEADLGRAMIEGYMQWLAETGADSGFRVVSAEQPLVADPRFPDFPHARLLVKQDVRVVNEADGSTSFLDHKTAQNFPDMVTWAHLNPQMRHYMLTEFMHLLGLKESAEAAEGARTDGAILNILRKVKRTATAKPPFYERHRIRHNTDTMRSHWAKVHGVLIMMEQMRQALDAGADHREVVPPTPSRDCSWKCQFFAICSSFDDGSHVEAFIGENLVSVDPLKRYEPELRDVLA